MGGFSAEVLAAAAREREVRLATYGRKTGKPHSVTIWITTDGKRLFVRSGEGMSRDWPQNLVARSEAVLRVGKFEVKVKPRHITEPTEARAVSALYRGKYGAFVRVSRPEQPLTLGEQTTFELVPAEDT